MPSSNEAYKIVGAYSDGAMQLEQGEHSYLLGGKDHAERPHELQLQELPLDFTVVDFQRVHGDVMVARELFEQLFGSGGTVAPNTSIQSDTPLPLSVIRLISEYLYLYRNYRHVSRPIPLRMDGVDIKVDHQRPLAPRLASDLRVQRVRKLTGEIDTRLAQVIRELREVITGLMGAAA